jgi:hypothetical protein
MSISEFSWDILKSLLDIEHFLFSNSQKPGTLPIFAARKTTSWCADEKNGSVPGFLG